MKKLFISQPMGGLTEEEILKAREEIRARAERAIGEPVELIRILLLKTTLRKSSISLYHFGVWENQYNFFPKLILHTLVATGEMREDVK